MSGDRIDNNCNGIPRPAGPCPNAAEEPSENSALFSDWPRDPDYRRLYLESKKRSELGDNFRIVLKAPFAQVGSPAKRTLGAGGDIAVSLPGVNLFDIGLGYINFPFEELGGTGQRMNIFMDFNRVSCHATFRLGAYAEMPQFGDFEGNLDKIAIGISPEIILNLYGDGFFRLGFGIAPGIGISAKGVSATIGIAPTLSLQF